MNKKQSLYLGSFAIQLIYLFSTYTMNLQAMDMRAIGMQTIDIDDQKNDDKKCAQLPMLTPSILAKMCHPKIARDMFLTKKKQKKLEQNFGEAILKKDTEAITHFIKNGIKINEHFECWVNQKNSKRLSRYRPLVFAIIYADKNNFNAVKVLLELGADIMFAREPYFYTNKIKSVEMAEQLYSQLIKEQLCSE